MAVGSQQLPMPTHTLIENSKNTNTPIPTLIDPNDLIAFISITDNSICKLPCWAGITPGETNWEEAKYLLAPSQSVAEYEVRENSDGLSGKENFISVYYSGPRLRISNHVHIIEIDKDKVNYLGLHVITFIRGNDINPAQPLPLPESFSMKRVLQEYGTPEAVLFRMYLDNFDDSHPQLATLLIYPTHRFIVEFLRRGNIDGNYAEFCDLDSSFDLLVVDNAEKIESAEAIYESVEVRKYDIMSWQSLEQVMGIFPERFYELYGNSNTECITFEMTDHG